MADILWQHEFSCSVWIWLQWHFDNFCFSDTIVLLWSDCLEEHLQTDIFPLFMHLVVSVDFTQWLFFFFRTCTVKATHKSLFILFHLSLLKHLSGGLPQAFTSTTARQASFPVVTTEKFSRGSWILMLNGLWVFTGVLNIVYRNKIIKEHLFWLAESSPGGGDSQGISKVLEWSHLLNAFLISPFVPSVSPLFASYANYS